MKIGIIMGGISSEKEISLESGRNIFSKIDKKNHTPVSVFMDSEGLLWEIPIKLLMRNSTKDIEADLEGGGRRIPYEELKDLVDMVYIGLHGKYGEDGCMQGLLELLKIPYVGSGVLASALCMDKYASRKVLAISGIDVPTTVKISAEEWKQSASAITDKIKKEVGLPCVIKPSREGCSTSVAKVSSEEGIEASVLSAFEWDNTALAEEFLEGMEVTCGVLGNEEPIALTPSETVPTSDILSLEDKFLYGQGENKTPARVSEEMLEKIRKTAVDSFRALGLKVYARIDMFVRNDGRVTVLEPNSLPGMTPSTVLFHQAAASGINQSKLIDRIIELSLEAHSKKRGPL